MKKICFVLLLTIALLCGCKNNIEDDIRTEVEQNATKIEDDENVSFEEEIEKDTSVIGQNISKDFKGDIIVRENNIVILKNDGSVWARGNNQYGQLGNGSRIDSEEFVQVNNIQNIIYLYANKNFGQKEDSKCYAIDSEGNLWAWGNNILSPKQIDLGHKIIKVKEENMLSEEDILVECEDGNNYFLFITSYAYNPVEALIRYDLPSDMARVSMNCCYDGENLVIYSYDSASGIVDLGSIILQTGEVHYNYEEYWRPVAIVDNIKNITYCSTIYNVGSHEIAHGITDSSYENKGLYCIDDKGEIYTISWKEMDKSHEVSELISSDIGISNTRKYFHNNIGNNKNYCNIVHLSLDGKMRLAGSNESGQLGDGTYYDYYESEGLSISEILFRDFYVGDFYNGEGYVVAISYDSNDIWAWGEGFGASPMCIVFSEEFENIEE